MNYKKTQKGNTIISGIKLMIRMNTLLKILKLPKKRAKHIICILNNANIELLHIE